MTVPTPADRPPAWVPLSAEVETGVVLGGDLVRPRTGDRYAERPEGLRRVINLSSFGGDPPDNPSEEPSASVG